MIEILKSLAQRSATGSMKHCGDGIAQWLFPFVLIVAYDFEEAYIVLRSSLTLLLTTLIGVLSP